MFFSFTKNNKHAPVGYIMCVAISDVKSSHLYLYSAFNNTNCKKFLMRDF